MKLYGSVANELLCLFDRDINCCACNQLYQYAQRQMADMLCAETGESGNIISDMPAEQCVNYQDIHCALSDDCQRGGDNLWRAAAYSVAEHIYDYESRCSAEHRKPHISAVVAHCQLHAAAVDKVSPDTCCREEDVGMLLALVQEIIFAHIVRRMIKRNADQRAIKAPGQPCADLSKMYAESDQRDHNAVLCQLVLAAVNEYISV